MSDPEKRIKWYDLCLKYPDILDASQFEKPVDIKPTKKSVDIPPKKESSSKSDKKRPDPSYYQKLGKKMIQQSSKTTSEMFKKDPDEWHKYHDSRDFSFEGYDKQDELPVPTIINYLETKKQHKLKILDLGCGRNKICEHFKDHDNYKITGYDHVSFNGSKQCDISDLTEETDNSKE